MLFVVSPHIYKNISILCTTHSLRDHNIVVVGYGWYTITITNISLQQLITIGGGGTVESVALT